VRDVVLVGVEKEAAFKFGRPAVAEAAFGFDRHAHGAIFRIDRDAREKRRVLRIVNGEARAGEENVAVQLGLYFDRAAPRVSNWYAVLADKALREVVLTGLGFPKEINVVGPDRLVEMLEDKFDVKDLKDEEKRSKLIKRFTLLYDLNNGVSGASSARISLFSALSPNSRSSGGQIITMDPSTIGAISRFS